MAKLADYGRLDYEDIADYKIPVETINTMLGLLAFPIVEQTILNDGITINVYEKSFWGRKHKGYISLRYIEDAQADITKFDYDDGSIPPENSEILIGMDFTCEYQRYYIPSHTQTYDLGRPRKQILSYGVMINNINSKHEVWQKLLMEQLLNSMADIFSPKPVNPLLTIMTDSYEALRKRFSVFEKYSGVKNEQ